MTEQNKAVVRRFYEEVLNQNRPEVAEEMVASDFVVHGGVPGTPGGPRAFVGIGRRLRAGFADSIFEIDDLVAEGDKVAVRWTMRGKHTGEYFGIAPTGVVVDLHAIVIFRVVDGRLAELWPLIDHPGLRRQIEAAVTAA